MSNDHPAERYAVNGITILLLQVEMVGWCSRNRSTQHLLLIGPKLSPSPENKVFPLASWQARAGPTGAHGCFSQIPRPTLTTQLRGCGDPLPTVRATPRDGNSAACRQGVSMIFPNLSLPPSHFFLLFPTTWNGTGPRAAQGQQQMDARMVTCWTLYLDIHTYIHSNSYLPYCCVVGKLFILLQGSS